MRIRTKTTISSLIMLSPILVLVIVFFVYPLFRVFFMSLQDWHPLGRPEFIGFSNYRGVLSSTEFWVSFYNTIIYTLIVTPMIMIPALYFAVVLNKTSLKSKFFRTVFFLPVAISFVVASYIWQWIYNDIYGLLNYILASIGLIDQPVVWLGETWLARVMVSVMVAWKTTGFSMMILLAGLQAIPHEVYEAAKIDGANSRQEFWRITLPLLRPTLMLALIISIAGSFKAFDHFYIMTGGGPMRTTQTIVMFINKYSFEFYRVGAGAAASVILLVVLLALSSLQLRIGGFRRND